MESSGFTLQEVVSIYAEVSDIVFQALLKKCWRLSWHNLEMEYNFVICLVFSEIYFLKLHHLSKTYLLYIFMYCNEQGAFSLKEGLIDLQGHIMSS